MFIDCNATTTDPRGPEYRFLFRTEHEYNSYLNGLKLYAERIPGKYRHKLIDIIVRFDSSSEPYDGDGVITRLYGDEALYFFRLISSTVAVLSLVDEEKESRNP